MELVSVRRDGAVVHLELNRPERLNAHTPAMWHELREVSAQLEADGTVKCLILSGKGRAFCSGLDRKEHEAGGTSPAAITGNPADSGRSERVAGDLVIAQQAFRWLTEAPYVTIAAAHGYVLGAGAELALACDIRIFADDVALALPEAELGMMPDMGGCDSLGRLVGFDRALEIALTCRRVGAQEALQLGLATRVVAPDELRSTATELAATIASRPLETIHHVKRAVRAAADGDSERSFTLARDGAARLGRLRRS